MFVQVGVLAVLAILLRKRPEALLLKAAVLRTNPLFQGQDKLVMLAWAYGQVDWAYFHCFSCVQIQN